MARDISVALELDNKQFNRSIKQSEQNVDRFSKQSTGSVNTLRNAFIALGGAAIIKSIVDVGASFQQLQNSLNVVFGSVEAGAAAFDRVQDIASGTQFSVQQLTQAFVQLKGAGVEPTERLLLTFANTASVTSDQLGTFQAALDLVSRSTAGGLGLEDLNRLADRGIPVFRIFSEELGLSRLEISEFGKSAEGAEILISTLLDALEREFGGALAGQVGLITFEMSQLNDALDKLKNALFETFGEATASGIRGLTDAINRLADNTDAIISLTKVFAGLLTVILSFGGVRIITALMGRFQGALTRLFKVMGDGRTKTAGLGAAFRALTGATQGSKFAGAIKGLTGISAAIATALAGVFTITGGFATLGRTLLRFAGIAGILFTAFEAGRFIFSLFKDEQEQVEKTVEKVTEEVEKNTEKLKEQKRLKELALIAEEAYQKGLRGTTKAVKEQTEAFDKNDPLFDYMTFLAAIFEEADKNLSGLSNLTMALKNVQIMLDIDPTNVKLIEAMRILNEMAESAKSEYTETSQVLKDFADVTDTLAKSTENYNMLLERLVELQTQGAISMKEFEQAKADLDEAFTENEGIENFLQTLGRAQKQLSEDLADAFLEGKDAMDSFKSFFKTLIKQIIADIIRLSIIQPILASILSPFGYGFGTGGNILKLAGGGKIMGNQPAIVGEEGPELFMPSTAGTVIPNGQFGVGGAPSQQVTYNINAVDTQSFQQALARDPEFLFAVTQQGARSLPRS